LLWPTCVYMIFQCIHFYIIQFINAKTDNNNDNDINTCF